MAGCTTMTFPGSLRYAATVGLLAAGYAVSAKSGLAFAIPPGNATAVWPAAGLAVAVLLLAGCRVWPGIWLGSVITNLTTDVSWAAACAMALGNTLEAVLACWLVRHFLDVRTLFSRTRDSFIFASLAGGSCVIAASVGVASLRLDGLVSGPQLVQNWWTWWLGDLASLMIVVPFVLACHERRWRILTATRWAEYVLLLLCVAAAGQCIFGDWLPERLAQNLVYMTMVLLIWVALRFDLFEITSATLLLCLAAIWGISRGVGAYRTEDSLFGLQIFMNVYAITGLALAGVMTQRRQAALAARTSQDQLNSAVSERERSQKWFRRLLESTPDATLVTGEDGVIVLVNAAAEEMFGYPPGALLGQPIEVLVPERHRQRHVQQRSDYNSAPHIRLMGRGLELSARRRDGHVFPVEIALGPMPTDEGLFVFCSIRDITERKHAEELLRRQEIQLLAAAEIQQQILPHEPPTLPGFDIAGRCYAAEFAAGDHFDYLRLPDGSLAVVLADVSGHGVGPAIITALLHARFHLLAELSSDLPQMARTLNARLHQETAGETFITLIVSRLDAQSRTLTCVNAGHPSGYVLDAAGEIKAEFESTGPPLALLPDAEFPTRGPVPLADGDLLFLFTDGLTEAHQTQGPLFGTARMLQILRESRDNSASEIIDALHAAVRDYLGTDKPRDDITMVVVKVGRS